VQGGIPEEAPGVIVYGNLNVDIVVYVETIPERGTEIEAREVHEGGGGSAANTAVALAKLGVPTCLLACYGNDLLGRFALDDLKREGVNTSLMRRVDVPTGRVYIVVDRYGERTMIAFRGANNAATPEILKDKRIEQALWIHVSGGKRDIGLKLLELADRAGIPNSYDPGSAAYRACEEELKLLLKYTHLLLVNEKELDSLKKRNLPIPELVVLKRGSKGAAILAGGEVIEVPGFKVDVVDTTGAGDAFNAGLLAGLSYGLELSEAVVLANATAALKITRKGARASPTLSEVCAFLAENEFEDIEQKLLRFRD